MAGQLPDFIKKPHVFTEFKNRLELDDFMKCADQKTGYKHFMNNFFMIQHSTKGSIQFVPREYQVDYMDICHNYNRVISLQSRQMGKSTVAAGYLLWYAMFVPDSTILVAAHVFKGAGEIMQRVRFAYENCPMHIKAGVTAYNKGSIEFDNGSRIVSSATTETTGRGMSISLLYADEFAFVRKSISSAFLSSIAPTLATGGRAIFTSTPNSDEDDFARLWKDANKTLDEFGNTTDIGVNGYKAYKALWFKNPEYDKTWEAKMFAELGEEKFNREIKCEFISVEETLINANYLKDLKGIEPETKHGQVRWYRQPVKGGVYTISLDPAVGTGGDNAAIQIFEANTTTQIGEWSHNKTTIPDQVKLIQQIAQYIADITNEPNNIYYSVENNGVGEAALVSLNELGEHSIKGIFMSETGRKRKGFTTVNKSKIQACTKFKSLVEKNKLTINSIPLVSELKNFVASGSGYAAKTGEKDDLVMSTLLAVRMFQQLADFDVTLERQIRDHAEIIQPYPFFAVFG